MAPPQLKSGAACRIKTAIATTNEKITAARPLTYWSSAMCDCRGLPFWQYEMKNSTSPATWRE